MLDVLLGLTLHYCPDAECTRNLMSSGRILMAGLALFFPHSDSFHFSFQCYTILRDVLEVSSGKAERRVCVIEGLVFGSCCYS